mgnify:CR=1 FL=1
MCEKSLNYINLKKIIVHNTLNLQNICKKISAKHFDVKIRKNVGKKCGKISWRRAATESEREGSFRNKGKLSIGAKQLTNKKSDGQSKNEANKKDAKNKTNKYTDK